MPFRDVFNESLLKLAKIEVRRIMQVLDVPEEKALLYLVACAEARLLAEERQRGRRAREIWDALWSGVGTIKRKVEEAFGWKA